MTAAEEDARGGKDVLGGHLWTLLAAGVIIVLIVMVVGGVKIASLHHRAAPAAVAPGRTVTVPTGTTNPGTAAAPPLTAAPVVSWLLWEKVALPVTPTQPRLMTDRSAGFDHTPTGALLAAVHGLLRADRGSAAQQRAEIRQALTEPGRTSLLARVPIPQLTNPMQSAAFRMPSYDPQQAVIQVAVRYTDPGSGTASYREVELSVLWLDGDWRISGTSGVVIPLAALTGFITFAGAG